MGNFLKAPKIRNPFPRRPTKEWPKNKWKLPSPHLGKKKKNGGKPSLKKNKGVKPLRKFGYKKRPLRSKPTSGPPIKKGKFPSSSLAQKG